MTIAICQICKKEFKTTHRNHKLCSLVCYGKYRKGKPLYKIRRGVIKFCKVCGKEFYVEQCRKDKAFFCSRICSGKFNLTKRFIKRTTLCSVCGKEFTRIGIHSNPSKYCSNKCKKHAQYWSGSKLIIRCIKCSKEFPVNKCQRYKRKYCSNECKYQDQKDSVKTIYKRNGVKRYFQRRNLIHKCGECGYDEHPEILGIHHKDLDPKNHSLDNLVVLCPNCHAIKHGRHLIHWGGHSSN